MTLDQFHIEAIAKASTATKDRPVFEVRLVAGGNVVLDYVVVGPCYTKTSAGYVLSPWGLLVSAATKNARPAARVHPGVLVGRTVRAEVVADEHAGTRIVCYRSAASK